MQRTTIAVLASVLLVVSAAGVGSVAAQDAEAYSGTNVTFETENGAVVDYAVDGQTMIESVETQSQSSAESEGSVEAGVSLSAVTDVSGSALSVESTTETSASVSAESGAEMTAHDNEHGILVVSSGEESQYVTANLSSSTEAEQSGESRVVVTKEDGTQGTFIVVGDGEVTVNEAGNVSADLGQDGTLVFRSYPDERSSEDEQQEQLIADGTAAAEVYVMNSAESGSESGGELATDVVTYGQDTTVNVTERSEGTVRMTVERSQEQGKVVITSVSEEAISSTEDMQVTVDGEAAARASSYSEHESAADGGDRSKFLVKQSSSAEASADVLVAINEFSSKEVAMTEGGGGSDGDSAGGSGDDATSTSAPGLGVSAAVLALLSVAMLARRRA
ncbi:PGF-CTERM sorting domain-containing protein [Halolamina rubra]|uniref:PGF-CTERM sorting domain-containing protein n=1 Tax=Halolamina rubra TaxID=1380430 RepID=UPI0006793D02|nr:PGF-CTERM sorting domain-containing protein [Halolamina rubra]